MNKISKCKSRAYKILTSKQGVNIVVTADPGDTFFNMAHKCRKKQLK